jgi:hypothetical protein
MEGWQLPERVDSGKQGGPPTSRGRVQQHRNLAGDAWIA